MTTPTTKLDADEWRPDDDDEAEDESSDSEVEEILSKSPELKIRDVDDNFQLRWADAWQIARTIKVGVERVWFF